MFEKESEWSRFKALMTRTGSSIEEISRQTRIDMATLTSYDKQFHGKRTLATAPTTIPEGLKPFAVGFRFLHLNRWAGTVEETQARHDYDAGLIELATGKYRVDGLEAYVMFAIPRKIVAKKREPYFSAQVYT